MTSEAETPRLDYSSLDDPDIRSQPKGTARRILANPLGAVSTIFLLCVGLVALLGTLISPFDPNATSLGEAFASPDGSHVLGQDSAGRDVLSRLIIGARPTMLSAALAAAVAIGLGLPLGLIAGYFGGRFDIIASWICDILMALPSIIVLLAVSASLGQSVWITMSIFGVMMMPGLFRVTRAAVRGVRGELYVDAARVSGVTTASIIGRHVLRVVRAPIIIQASMIAGVAITIQASLEFLGLGDPLTPTWGAMLNEGFLNIYTAPGLTVWPAIAITLTIAAFVILGNALRDALEDNNRIAVPRQSISSARDIGERGRFESTTDALLEIRGLTISYPSLEEASGLHEVVSDVSFDVHKKQVLGIVGESGSGKTQTIFSLLGLLPDQALLTAGEVRFQGQTILKANGPNRGFPAIDVLRGRRIAYVPQEPMANLDPNFTVGYQLLRPLTRVLGMKKEAGRRHALDLLDRVGMKDPKKVYESFPHQLSGGMAQRVLIAGAVSCDPELLLADEPTTALDVTVQAEVLDLLRGLQHEFSLSVVFVTHNLGVVADLCNDVLVMKEGRIVEQGPVDEVLRNPRHPYTQSLLGASLYGREPMQLLNADRNDEEAR